MNGRQSTDPLVPRAVERPGEEPDSRRLHTTLSLSGLACGGGGSLTVERALQAAPGVIRAYANPATEMAYVEYDPRETDVDRLEIVVRSLGYGTEEGAA